ncbi:ribose-phosphate pyrophosphokinase [Wolbachia endosymbiont of Armadillidium vulgare str. wVulC]|uniref:ribose-phosphate pyrophosphokinase-like domain-containing protein n=1 Tax=unclassified Wolbachia TaxID=2640676 RepID=UPI0006D4C5C6|nr:ribose-phosphate pyrophosphokinase-like domain-containing protein [Wolbachia endosymbiont of Armadillidium vulgare]KLT22863.1 ribose-phosphate pyrophosphokinase [Wolbachia endosymbiont of Armadillidium vulgare str. wVulC]OJH31661.1 Ribose-phosphate pyrophosphokinase [Wolbachia endosymbiont of Armadillidium vulgare]OJH32070.1 Ribose-phosphate pyrophosphokinase [Wolbachia endosymbiont of Armadillidium vulgare]OJH32627.1 Ribose-phosphate pyrophosphokinase [Wolbachia endosymbiont of Armadillidiu
MKAIIGGASKGLENSIASGLNVQLFPTRVLRFADGKVNVEVANGLHNQEVCVFLHL